MYMYMYMCVYIYIYIHIIPISVDMYRCPFLPRVVLRGLSAVTAKPSGVPTCPLTPCWTRRKLHSPGRTYSLTSLH